MCLIYQHKLDFSLLLLLLLFSFFPSSFCFTPISPSLLQLLPFLSPSFSVTAIRHLPQIFLLFFYFFLFLLFPPLPSNEEVSPPLLFVTSFLYALQPHFSQFALSFVYTYMYVFSVYPGNTIGLGTMEPSFRHNLPISLGRGRTRSST